MAQVIIVPYFSEPEVDRYVRIAARLREFANQQTDYSFLLASSPKIEPSGRLFDCFSQIAKTEVLRCPTQIFGYPQGPTAMFWDCMEYIEAESPADGGFSLWLESDMVPVAPDWIDRLTAQWNSHDPTPLLMGCLVPKVKKRRLFRKPRIWIHEHINGGACYAKNFSSAMPEEARDYVFDLSVYAFAKEMKRAATTSAIGFATVDKLAEALANPNRVLLHGYMQDKDEFITGCLTTDREGLPRPTTPPAWQASLARTCRMLKARYVTKGPRGLLDTIFVHQEKAEMAKRRAA